MSMNEAVRPDPAGWGAAMEEQRGYFSVAAEPMRDIDGVLQGISARIIADMDAVARDAIESVRGAAKAQGPMIVNNGVESYRCSVCGPLTHTVTAYKPMFCQRCGRIFGNMGEE